MSESVNTWINRAEPHPDLLGSFLRAVLTNNLVEAFAHADWENRSRMRDWASFLYNDMPSPAWGSEEKLIAWYEAHHTPQANAAEPVADIALHQDGSLTTR